MLLHNDGHWKVSSVIYKQTLAAEYGRLLNRGSIPEEIARLLEEAVALAGDSTTFKLPLNGLLLDDPGLRALDDIGELRLPFRRVALEFDSDDADSPKRVLLVEQFADALRLLSCFWSKPLQRWIVQRPMGLPTTGWIDRSNLKRDGYPGLSIADLNSRAERETHVFVNDAASDFYIVLSFLNALSCSNVQARPLRFTPHKRTSGMGLHEDVFHELVLTMPGAAGEGTSASSSDRRSPREHLRRGHVRHLESGVKVWINATVVSSGSGVGRVEKIYRLRSSA